jgi:hypothetical protein
MFMKRRRAAHLLLVPCLLAEVALVHHSFAQKAGRPSSQKRGAHAPGISEEEENRKAKQIFNAGKPARPYVPGVQVAVRFDSERSVFQNSGRWTFYPDDIYLEPDEDAIYMIASRGGSSDDMSLLIAEMFTKYRGYANSVCPSKVSERLQDPAIRKRLEEAYTEAAESQKQLLNRTLSYEEYVRNIPDCEVGGNLWRTAIRFADMGWERMLVRFPNDVPIRSSLSSNPGENHIHLLKAHLRREGKILRSPLTAGER